MKEYAYCDIQNRDYVDKDVVLYATLLLYYPIVLGHPQLKKHNPKANQADGLWEFNDPYCVQNYNQTRHLTRQKGLREVPKRYIPNLNYRDVTTVSIYAIRVYARRGYRIGIVTLKDLDEAL